MLASAVAWALAIIFASAGIEKLLIRELRSNFVEAGERLLGLPGARWWVSLFLAGELLVLPLLFLHATVGLRLLVVLTLAVTILGLRAWALGETKACGCGGLWAATGSRLALRNVALLVLALYSLAAAPTPLELAGLLYALGALLLILLLAGITEGIRMHLRTQ